MAFHRLTDPSYFGGLPVGYDKINDPAHVSVGGSGVPALTMGKKTGGPNDGTYFVAFGEDAQSRHANRAAAALAENTDALDDIQRTSIPTITSVDATAAGAVSSIALVGEIFVGINGTTNNQANRNKIVRITDQSDNDIEVSGSKIVVTLMHDGASTNVVGTLASGFRTNATLTVSPPIPNGTTYRVWFGTRNNYANIALVDKDALFQETMRTIQNVSGEVRSLFRQIHSETSINQAWDAAFDSTIRSLASSGLNERYRRATLQPAGFVSGDFNVPGSGAVIFKDGPAVEIQHEEFILSLSDYRDPNHSAFKITTETARSATSSALSSSVGGAIGYWHELEWRTKNSGDGSQFTRGISAGPALVEVIPWDIRADTYGADTHRTRISPADATAILNPDSGSGTTARKTVECAAGQYFALTTPTRTSIRCGVDMLEVTRSDNSVQTYVIVAILAANRVEVETLIGTSPLFPTTAETGCSIRWLQVVTSIGGPMHRDEGSAGTYVRPLLSLPPAIATTAPANELVGPCAYFGSQTGSVVDATAQARRARALEFGSTGNPDSGGTVDGTLLVNGWLNGDGSARFRSVDVNGAMSITSAGVVVLGTVSFGLNGVITGPSITLGSFSATTGGVISGVSMTLSGDATVDDISADQIVAATVRELLPEKYVHIREDWLRFFHNTTLGVLHTSQGMWDIVELDDNFTLNNGSPTAKNPGRLQVIGAGGGVTRQLSIRTTPQLPFAFADILTATMIVAITEDPANLATSFGMGFVDNAAVQNGGDDALALFYQAGSGWRLQHRVGGGAGANNLAVLGAHTDAQFVVVRFLKIANGDMQIYFNGSLSLTVASANLPAGNCTFNMHFLQSVADAEPTIYNVDFIDFVVDTGASRAGA